jgi:nitrous oxide reductase accessory protein NosL
MTTNRSARIVRVALALTVALIVAALAGCGGSKGAQPPTPISITAKTALKAAMSAVATQAPDGKVLVVQTAQPVTATSTPTWEFLIGSPKTNVIYEVRVQDGQAQAQTYGTANLTPAEWAAVPANDQWKIDSDAALAKALAAYPNGRNAAYLPGLVTYVPKSAQDSNSRPMKWIIMFDPTTKGSAATSTVDVDVTTGEAALAK